MTLTATGRRRTRGAAKAVVLLWVLIGTVYALIKILAYIARDNTTVVLLSFEAIICSCFYGFLGWQVSGKKLS